MENIYAVVPGEVCFVCHTSLQAPVEHFMCSIGYGGKYYLSETHPEEGSKDDGPVTSYVAIDEENYVFTIYK